jgi:hypothetical protein
MHECMQDRLAIVKLCELLRIGANLTSMHHPNPFICCVLMHTYTHACARTHTNMHTLALFTHTSVHTNMHTHKHAYTFTHTHAYTHANTQTCIRTCLPTHACTRMQSHTHASHTCMHTLRSFFAIPNRTKLAFYLEAFTHDGGTRWIFL